MTKFIRWISVFVATALWAFISIAGFGIAAARAFLPPTGCAVAEAQVDALVLEKMTRDDVTAKLGCPGVLKQRQDYGGQIVIEDYAWRGDAWPYAHFQGHFINGVLHGTEKRWLTLNVKW